MHRGTFGRVARGGRYRKSRWAKLAPRTDTAPDAFTIPAQTNVALSSTIISATVTPVGFDADTPITVTGGQYSINSGAFTSTAGTFRPGNSFRVQVAAAATFNTATSCTVTIGGIASTFTVTTATGTQAVLTQTDLTMLGFIRLPTDAGMTDVSGTQFMNPALRILPNGDRRIAFHVSPLNLNTLVEVDITGMTPSLLMTSAPRATFVASYPGMDAIVIRTGAGYFPGGCGWDPFQAVYWSIIGDAYTGGGALPTLLAYKPSTNTWYGPWTFQVDGIADMQKSRGTVGTLPSWFTTTYCPGKNMYISSTQSSGAGGPYGPIMHAWASFDPATVPPSTTDGTTITHHLIPTTKLIEFNQTHKKSRTADYNWCGIGKSPVDGHYNCSFGNTLELGITSWGGQDDGSATTDTPLGCAFVDTVGRKAALFFGQLAGTYPDHPAPFPANHLNCRGYGDAFTYSGPDAIANQCCHGNVDIYWGTTGPYASGKRFTAMIYDPAELGAIATGANSYWLATQASEFNVRDIANGSVFDIVNTPQNAYHGAVVDNETKRLYVIGHPYLFDHTSGFANWPCLLVFGIAA